MRVILCLLVALVAGCATTAGMNKELATNWVGKPAESFFIKNGPPINLYRAQDGQRVYTWSKREVAFMIHLYCDLRIVTDAQGITTDISVSGSSLGAWTTSYCNEISW